MTTDDTSSVVAPMDALLLKGDADPSTRAIMSTALVLETEPDFDRLLSVFEQASLSVPRMRARVHRSLWSMGQPRWATDVDFDVRHHVRHIGAPGRAGLAEVLDLASGYATAPFDAARPLWDATLVTGLSDGTAVLLLRAHHAIADGVRALQMMAQLLTLTPDAEAAEDGTAGAPQPGSHERLRAFADTARHQQATARAIAAALSHSAVRPMSAAVHAANYGRSALRTFSASGAKPSPLLRHRSRGRTYRTLELDLAEVRACAHAAGATVNDVFLTGLLGGFRRYHECLGTPIGDVPTTFPVNAAGNTDIASGNHFTAAVIPGPSTIEDPIQRLQAVHRLVAARRQEIGLDAPIRLAPFVHQVPSWLSNVSLAAYSRRIDLQASNVIGPDCPVYLAGAKVRRLFAFGPLPGIPVMAVLVSYDGVCTIGLTTDPAAVGFPDLLVDSIEQSFAELFSAA